MDVLTKLSVDSFLDRVADRTPTPGGGSVTGVAGALACDLARMVAAYSVGKASRDPQDAPSAGRAEARGSVGEAETLQSWADQLHRADQLIRALVTQDATAYADMTASKNRAKTTSDDPTAQAAYTDAVLAAVAVPMEMAAVASNALATMDEFKTVASRYLLSDLAIAAVLADATARAARYTLRINARELSDASTRAKVLANIDRIVEHCAGHLESVDGFVSDRLEHDAGGSR